MELDLDLVGEAGGVVFDTRRAPRIATLENLCPWTHGDPPTASWAGTLHRHAVTGQLFIAGSGGPDSMFAERIEEDGQAVWCGGAGFVFVSSEAEARDLAVRGGLRSLVARGRRVEG